MSTLLPEQAAVAAASVTHPTSCPPWCKDSRYPAGHNHGPRDTAHRSLSLMFANPNPQVGEDVLVRAELFQLDELSGTGETVLYLEGETPFQVNGPEADVFIAQAQAFVDGLRVLRRQMGGGQ